MNRLRLNKDWHAKHQMPTRATLAMRIQWHLAHQKHCACRPIPAKLAEVIKNRGLI
jgi:hypothetical protein